MKELTNINFRRYKWRLPALIALLVVVVAGSFWLNTAPFRSGFEITDELRQHLSFQYSFCSDDGCSSHCSG